MVSRHSIELLFQFRELVASTFRRKMKSDDSDNRIVTEEKKLNSVKDDVTAEVVSYEKVNF